MVRATHQGLVGYIWLGVPRMEYLKRYPSGRTSRELVNYQNVLQPLLLGDECQPVLCRPMGTNEHRERAEVREIPGRSNKDT